MARSAGPWTNATPTRERVREKMPEGKERVAVEYAPEQCQTMVDAVTAFP